jgi:PKHD-type hydroxylase
VTVQLSQEGDYEGGDFELEEVQKAPDRAGQRIKALTEARQRGTVLVFPSFLYHRVTPVTSGMRRSLVAWYLGPPWV